MDSDSEDRVGTLIKVNQFLTDQADAFSTNTSIESERVILEEDTEEIFQLDSVATRKLKGFTDNKSDKAVALENIVLLVRAACIGYYTLHKDPGKLGIVSFPDTKVKAARDNDLYMIADQVYDIANPIKALLGPFQVTSGQVDSILTIKADYKGVLQQPRLEQGVSIAAGEERDRLIDKCFKITLVNLDAYVLPFKYTTPVLYSVYETARAIDNSGGGSDSTGYSVANHAIAPGATVSIGTPPAPDVFIYMRQIGGVVGVTVCEANAVDTACPSGFELTPGATVKRAYGDLMLAHGVVINLTNTGHVTVTVRLGFKS